MKKLMAKAAVSILVAANAFLTPITAKAEDCGTAGSTVVGAGAGLYFLGGPLGIAAGALLGHDHGKSACQQQELDRINREVERRADGQCYYRDGRPAPCPQ